MRGFATGVLLLFLSFQVCDQGDDLQVWQDSLSAYWSSMEAEFKDLEESPLKAEDRAVFDHFDRFSANGSFRVMATFEPIADAVAFEMKTSTDRKPQYRSVGVLHFNLGVEKVAIPVYEPAQKLNVPEFEQYLFLPFTDLTNGEETYGGGRYLDLNGPLDETVELDFNRAYNPYCAYNDRYSCPVPPMENHIPVRVEAGVKTFGDH